MSNLKRVNSLEAYKRALGDRDDVWLFKDLEDTPITDPDRIEKVKFVQEIAFRTSDLYNIKSFFHRVHMEILELFNTAISMCYKDVICYNNVK